MMKLKLISWILATVYMTAKYDYYHQEKNKLKADKKDDPNLKYFSDIHTKEILDNMGLIRYCCRRSVMSAVDLMDVI